MRETVKGVGFFVLCISILIGVEQANYHYHRRSMIDRGELREMVERAERERAALRARLDDLVVRVNRMSERVDSVMLRDRPAGPAANY